MPASASKRPRISPQLWGVICEWRVIGYLWIRGYRVLARRYTPGRGLGEIDIVARRAGVVCLVEVKARRFAGPVTMEQVSGLLSQNQWHRLQRTARARFSRQTDVRLDLAVVTQRLRVYYFAGLESSVN